MARPSCSGIGEGPVRMAAKLGSDAGMYGGFMWVIQYDMIYIYIYYDAGENMLEYIFMWD